MDAAATGTRWKQLLAEHPAAVDAAWATLFVVIAFVSTSGTPSNRDVVEPTSKALGTLLLLGTAVPYYVRRKAPFAVFVLASSAVLVLSGLGYFEGATPAVALFGAFTVGARCRPRWVAGGYAFVVVGLLALSVAISLVGVGNTLALSVHERARETALLRALGTTRGQIRRMLALEGGLLAGVGTVLGILAGVGYGVAGAAALMGTQVPLAIDIPWLPLAAIALGALATGVLASALPGRRAVAASPAELLAQE